MIHCFAAVPVKTIIELFRTESDGPIRRNTLVEHIYIVPRLKIKEGPRHKGTGREENPLDSRYRRERPSFGIIARHACSCVENQARSGL